MDELSVRRVGRRCQRKSLKFYQTDCARLQSSRLVNLTLPPRTRMPRFYCNQPLETGGQIHLPDEVARHIGVLRMQPGDTLTLFNGAGGEFTATLLAVDRRSARAELMSFDSREAEPAHALTLAQALPEGSKMDWIIEKAVELGASAIQPVQAARSVVRLTDERATKRLAHWQGVAIAAAEQCGRNRLPAIAPPLGFMAWVAQPDSHPRILLSPRAGRSLSDWARHQRPQALTVMIGPEGGFSDAEEHAAIAHGALCLSLGPRVLRTETAGLAVLAALNAIWGEC